MNERKWKQLLAAARNESPPAPSAAFEMNVMHAVRRRQPVENPETLSLFDPLNLLFPRLAWAAAAIIALSVAVDVGLTACGVPGVDDGVSQISTQWLLTPNGF